MTESKDYRPERLKLNQININWRETLDSLCITGDSVAYQTSKNYEAHLNKKYKEIKEASEGKNIRDSFTVEQLERHTRLEQTQIDALEEVEKRDKALKELKRVRENKDLWWE